MSIERYDGSRKGVAPQKTKARVARTSQAAPPRQKSRFDKGDKVRFEGGNIVEPPVGAVIAISGRLANSFGPESARRVYDYAAIRANNGRWYTTGNTCPAFGYNWAGFLTFLQSFIDPTGERLR